MKYYSTNDINHKSDFRTAVIKGLASDGGLYMPEFIPRLDSGFIGKLPKLSLPEIAETVISLYIDEISTADLSRIITDAINFDAPVVQLDEKTAVLELFHGPTLAFKDFGARFLARIMAYYQQDENKELIILVATSGDTGSAVANGFLGMDGVKVCLLYPSGKVSKIQEQQLTTIGGNVTAFEINGTFDDCQRLVKTAFIDEKLRKKFKLSSANSINLARLLPQSLYYFSAFGQMDLSNNEPLLYCVPSGNFGNLTAGLIAGKMGLPVHHYIAAVNANHVFYDYLQDGSYRAQDTIHTLSNAMDVGDPSNFKRIAALFEHNHQEIKKYISSYWVSDEITMCIIREVYDKYNYVLDPHGAVGYEALKRYRFEKKYDGKAVFLETAHPGKFADTVKDALNKDIELPNSLLECLLKKKAAITVPSEFESFREILINNI